MKLKFDCEQPVYVRPSVFEDTGPASVPAAVYTFVYTYPLSTPAKFEHKISPEMSVNDILSLGHKDYHRIYAVEESSTGKVGNIPGMLNRQTSSGIYGIWGHSIDDLCFVEVVVDTEELTVKFGVDS